MNDSIYTWHEDESGTEYGTCSIHGTTWVAGQDLCHGCVPHLDDSTD